MNVKEVLLRRGDHVRVRRDPGDEWCEGYVVVASESGVSIGLLLGGGMVRAGEGYIAGALPLIIDVEEGTATGLTGDEYFIEIAT